MTDAAQAANKENAQKSTGPKTEQGRAKSAGNSLRHGLTSATPTYLNPEDQADYEAIKQRLEKECLPSTELERQAFERYAFSTYQAQRAQRLEASTQDRWIDDPDNQQLFHQMERYIKLTALLERRADNAINELRKLQRDRLATLQVHNELYILEQKVEIPLTLPTSQILSNYYKQTGPATLAIQIISYTQDVQDIIKNQTPPKDPTQYKLSAEDIIELAAMAGKIK